MPIDPSIPLAVKVPEQPSPIQTIGGLMQVRDAASQIALRNAQTAQSQQQTADIAEQTQQRQRDNQSWNQVQTLLRDPDVQGKLGKGDLSPILGAGLTPNVAKATTDWVQGMAKNANSISTDNAARYAAGRAALGQGLLGLDPKNDKIAYAQAIGLKQNLMADHPEVAQQFEVPSLGPNFRQALQDSAAKNGVAYSMLKNVADLAKTNAETTDLAAKTDASKAAAGVDLAKTPGEIADSKRKQMITKAMEDAQAGIQNGVHPVDAILGKIDPAAAAAYKPAYDTALANGGPEAAKSILEAAATHAGSIALATNPQVKAAEVAKQVEIERQTLPMKISAAVAQARAMMGTGATANVPPHLAVPAIGEYEKAGQAYAGALSAADEMNTLINSARSGNKVAYAYAPTTGVLTINSANGVKRVNMAEIQQYAGAGSAADAVQGFLGKLTSGASIDNDVLNNMQQIHGQLAATAKDAYQRKIQVINGSYGSKFEPLDLQPGGSAAPLPKGGGKVIDSATAQKFYDAAGRDPAKARQLAQQNGWKTQ